MEDQHHEIINHVELLQHLGVDTGHAFADLGCGREGAFTAAAADVIGESGFVYAVDVMEDALESIKARAAREGHSNIVTVWTDLEMYGAAQQIRDHSLDSAVLSDTLFQSREREDILREAARMLKVGGKLMVLDWKPQAIAMGPPDEQRVTTAEIKELGTHVGLESADEFDAGAYHWALILQKTAA